MFTVTLWIRPSFGSVVSRDDQFHLICQFPLLTDISQLPLWVVYLLVVKPGSFYLSSELGSWILLRLSAVVGINSSLNSTVLSIDKVA